MCYYLIKTVYCNLVVYTYMKDNNGEKKKKVHKLTNFISKLLLFDIIHHISIKLDRTEFFFFFFLLQNDMLRYALVSHFAINSKIC